MNKKNLIALSAFAVLTLSSFLCGCGAKQTSNGGSQLNDKDKNYEIKLGYYNCDHMVAACVAKDKGIFDKLGLKVTVTGNGKVPEAMAAGKMDAGYIGSSGLMRAQLKGSPIVIGANNHIGGSMYLVVSNNITKPEDLLGKKLGIGTKPEEDDRWLMCARKLNIPIEAKNYQAVQFGSDKDKYLALKAGQIDGFICCDPWGSVAEYEKAGRIMATADKMPGVDEWGVCCVYSLNKNFIKDHPELAKKMILAHAQSLEYIYTHPISAGKIFAKNYNVPEEVGIKTIYMKTVAEGRTLSWKIDEKAIKREIDIHLKENLLEKAPKYEELAVDKYLKESGADDFDKFIKEKVDPIFPVGMSYDDWKKKAMEIDKE